MSIGTVDEANRDHMMSQLDQMILDIDNADELSKLLVSVGLAQNLGALKALATDGIQKGHMTLHSRSVAIAAGATGEMVEIIAKKLVEAKEIRVGKAKEI